MNGLKNVGYRYDDALSGVGRAELERLLATYYREVGWWVEHAGTGTGDTGAQFDDGVDLRIRRDAQVVLVRCKHWNVEQVPHNAVHELIGAMVNEAATGAILVSSGEFTPAAIEAANRHGYVKLIDADALRGMLGSLLEPEDAQSHATAPTAVLVRTASAEHRRTSLLQWSLALVFAIGFFLIVRAMLVRTADTVAEPDREATSARAAQPTIVGHEPQPAIDRPVAAVPSAVPRPPTEAEIEESQRKADEAMRVIEHSTPEIEPREH
jgi:restriction system protein